MIACSVLGSCGLQCALHWDHWSSHLHVLVGNQHTLALECHKSLKAMVASIWGWLGCINTEASHADGVLVDDACYGSRQGFVAQVPNIY